MLGAGLQIWRYAVCWTRRNPETRLSPPSGVLGASPRGRQVLVLVGSWAWLWRCAATIAVNGATMLVSASSESEDWEQQSSQPSVGCPAGPHVDSEEDRTEARRSTRSSRRSL